MLLERIAERFMTQRRLRRLRGTVAAELSSGHIDSLELLDLAKSLNPTVIYDIGANVGTWTLLAKAVLPTTRVHAFEPIEAHAEEYLRNTAALSDVVLHQTALGTDTGSALIHITSVSDASSLLPLTEEGARTWRLAEARQQRVPVASLDEYVRRHVLPAPDLIKLDVQGYELKVLEGADVCLRQASAIICEVSFQEYYEEQALFGDIVRHLATYGFGVHAFSVATALGVPLQQSDVLFTTRRTRGSVGTLFPRND